MMPFSPLLLDLRPILTRGDVARAGAARALGDHGLLLDLEVLVDVFAVDAQFPGAGAIGAALAPGELLDVEDTGFLVDGRRHGHPPLQLWPDCSGEGAKNKA